MRVLAMAHYHQGSNRGGAELMLHALLRALAEAGHEVWMAATRSPVGEHLIDGVRVISGPASRTLLKQGPWDLAVTHLTETTRTVAWARAHLVPVATVVHSTHPWIGADLAFGADLAVFNSRWVADHHHRRGWTGHHLVVHPPVDAAEHRTRPGSRVTLVNLIPEKGSHLFYRLAERLPHLDFLGVIGGYETHRQDVRVLPNVRIQAHTARMRDEVWANTRVLLVPSDYESYGLVGPEAMCSGIPVLAHPTPGTREALGSAGTYLDRDDVDAWERALRRWEDPTKWAKASHAAAERARHLDPAPELAAWVEAAEKAGARC
ncbi:glycosyltransferase family 4 protein [Nocardiopsis flavescens]|uniref:glycosyltransferase family 4 protein n=1 Tax=Nocardiopsis flavescens TaxID=758803 RepID=UPI00365629DF